jgi:hypothetical protein
VKSLKRIGLAFLFSTLLSLSGFAQFGIITTVAGNGTSGFSGDGGLATSAQLSYYPYGVAVDADNNLYIGDTGNNCVRKVTPTGLITTVAGNGFGGFTGDGGPAISAQLNQPYGLAVDYAGNLYIADSNSERIRKVQAVSGVTTFFPQVAVGVDIPPCSQ